MLRSVAWLGDSGGGGGGDLVRFVWTGGLGLTLVCRGGSTGACGGLGLRDGGVIWGICLGGSGGGRSGGGSTMSSVSPNSGGGGSNGTLSSSLSSLWSSSGMRCCVARLVALASPAVPLMLEDGVWSLTRAGLGFCEVVGVCTFSRAAADFDLSSVTLCDVGKDKPDLGLAAKLFDRRSLEWMLAAR